MGVRAVPKWLALCLTVCLHACGGDSAPSPTSPSTLAPGPSDSAARSITGAVTDAIRGEALTGVTVALEGAGTAATDAAGHFIIDSGAPNGSYRTTLSGAGIVTRQTAVVLRSSPLAFTAIPSGFDTASFDQFARSLAGGVLIRWPAAPSLIVESSLVESPSNQNVALDERIHSAEVERVIARLSQVLPLLTGSRFGAFASVTRQTTPAGREIPMFATGSITVVYYTASNGACGQAGPIVSLPSYEIRSAAIWLRYGCATSNSTTMVHELGHALGYGHVSGSISVMRATGGVDVTDFDRAAGAIVSNRPAGNRAPDIDPDDFAIGSTTARSASGVLVIPPVP